MLPACPHPTRVVAASTKLLSNSLFSASFRADKDENEFKLVRPHSLHSEGQGWKSCLVAKGHWARDCSVPRDPRARPWNLLGMALGNMALR